jgi:hypothetical protein
MALTEAFAGSASIGTTEFSLPANSTSLGTNTTAGVYQLFLDLSALTATEQYVLKLYEKVQSSSTKRVFRTVTFNGAQSDPNFCEAAIGLMNGWDMTLTKVLGTSRTIEWSIRKA